MSAHVEMPTCDMVRDCPEPITYIDHKGFVYCTTHGKARQSYCRCRKLAAWEVKVLIRGEQLQSYEPITRKQHEQRVAKAKAALEGKEEN